MTVKEKINAIRGLMREKNLKAYIVPSTDPHMGEYVAECWLSRAWVSGFSGSAGTVVITDSKAGLWTDSRYFLQAGIQLEGSGIDLFKMGLPETPDYPEWLAAELGKGDRVGFDGNVVPVSLMRSLKTAFELKGLETVSEFDLISPVWKDRPGVPMNEIFNYGIEYAGKSRSEKIAEIRAAMKARMVDAFIIPALDDMAWTFNIRGTDVAYNPVAISFGMITEDKAYLFIEDGKVPAPLKAELRNDGIELLPYSAITGKVAAIEPGKNVMLDPAKTNVNIYNSIPAGCKIIEGMSLAFKMKSRKNEVEIAGERKAMEKDAVAMTKFFHWLETRVGKDEITEMCIAEKLRELRSAQGNFYGESFSTIAGYRAHGAIVHYSATPGTNIKIEPEGFLLVDSGAQYLEGTTDITRMMHLGTPTDEEMTDYTLVLKGHIDLGMAKFPAGTRGSQLDILARKGLWERGWNYGHGTGHGVGCFLNVHEGPQSIRMDENPNVLEEGMVTSNEPGIYRTDKYGIRIENLVLTVPDCETEFGRFLKFETLTLCMIDKKPIKKELLTGEEIEWLNNYHKRVFEAAAPHLDDELKAWLKEKTSPLA